MRWKIFQKNNKKHRKEKIFIDDWKKPPYDAPKITFHGGCILG